MAGYGRIKDDEVVEGLHLGFLKGSGAWEILNHFRDTGKRNAMFKAWMVFHIIMMIPVTLSSIAGPFAIEKTLEGITVIMIGPMSTIQLFIKFNFYWKDTGFPTRLMELLKRNYLKSIPSSKRVTAEEILQKSAKIANFLGSIVVYTNLTTLTVWCLTPILRSEFFRCTLGMSFFGKAPPGQNKILAYWYPVDVEATPWTQIIYVYEILLMLWSAFMITLFEIMLAQFIVLLGGHLEVLQLLLSGLKNDANLTKKLPEYIDEHDKMAKIGHEMRHRLNFMVTTIIISGFMILIFTIFNFFMGSDKGDWIMSLRFMVYLAYVLVEVFVYCYASSELEVISEEVCYGAYCSEWNEMDIDSRKAIQMVMLRSRRAIVLRAGWYPVNIELLNNILQTAYSTSMLMYRVTTDDAS